MCQVAPDQTSHLDSHGSGLFPLVNFMVGHSAVGIVINSGGDIQYAEEYELLHWGWSHLVNMLLCCSIRMCEFGDGMYFLYLTRPILIMCVLTSTSTLSFSLTLGKRRLARHQRPCKHFNE